MIFDIIGFCKAKDNFEREGGGGGGGGGVGASLASLGEVTGCNGKELQ